MPQCKMHCQDAKRRPNINLTGKWYNGFMSVISEGKALHISFISNFYPFDNNLSSGHAIFLSILNIPPTCFVMFYMSNDDGDIEAKWLRYKRYGSKCSLIFAPLAWPMRPLALVYKTLQIRRAILK